MTVLLQIGNGFLLFWYFVYEHIAAFLQILPALGFLRFIEVPLFRDESVQAGPLGVRGTLSFPPRRAALLRRLLPLILTFLVSWCTSVLFPPPVGVFLLLIWVVGFAAAAFIRIDRPGLCMRTRQFIWAEVLVLWGLRLLRSVLEGALSSSAWPSFLGLSRESTTAILSRNIGYAYLVLLLLALFTVPGGFLWYIFQTLTVVRRSPTFRFATLREILADIIGRGEQEEVY
ncbi:MAG: hypothetical protein QW260_05645 [Thermoproteota archaeon]